MKTTIHQRVAHPLTRRLGRAAACAAIGLAGIVAPSAHGQTNTGGCTAAPAGLVGWWRAEGDANDAIGSVHGSLSGGTAFAPGVAGQAFQFDGVNDSVVNAAPGLTNIQESFTMEFWASPTAGRATTPETYSGIAGISNQRYAIYPLNGELGPVGAGVSVGTNGISVFEHGYVYLSSLLVYDAPISGWTHMAVVYENRQPKLYLNGTLVRTGLVSTRIPFPSTWLGEAGTNSLNYGFYAGLLDEVSIYDRPLTAPEVQAIFNAGSAGKCTTTNLPGGAGVPVITSFTPAAAIPGGQVVLAGQNFSPAAASNIVYFGATKATVLTASSNQLVVSVPSGATFAPPTVTVNGLTAAAQAAFTPTFTGTGMIASTNFAPRFSLGTGTGPTQTAIADFDGDGKPDLAVTDDYADSISVYRNISPGGALSGSHFESRIVLPASTANYSPYMLIAGDVDGDGRLDLVASDVDGNTVSVFRNQATPGSLSSNSFAPFITFAVGASPRAVALADLDGDGRPEIVTANYNSSTVSILHNVSSPGTITTTSFASRVDFAVGTGPQGLAVTDLDGDGRSDIATGNSSSHSLSLLRNLGTGTITSNLFATAVTFSGPNYGHYLKAIELDGDGRPELLVSSYLGQSVSLYRNQTTPGGFTATSFALVTAPALNGRGHTLACGDLNGDGKPDIAVDTELADSVTLFQNIHTSGDVTAASLGARVELPAGWNAWGTSIGDLDGDNRPDIVVANTYDNTISVYQNLAAMNTNPPSPSGWLLSVDFGSDLNGKTGFAALGQTTNDVWNFYSRNDGSGGWRTFGVLPNLITVDGTVTPVGLTVANAPGAWGNGSPDAMYDDYIYPFNGGNVTVTVTNLPAGQYDLLAYAYDGNFELTSGGVSHGVQTTRDNIRTNAPVWAAGVHYARFTNVSVAGGQPLVLTVRPGLDAYAVISGLQLSASLTTNTVPGTNPPAGNCVAVPTGAISWWRGEGSALDDIRSNNGSVVGGVTTVPGKVGNGFGFDGTGYIVVPHDPSLNNSNAFTIELWYKSTQNPNLDYGLIDKRVGFTGANFGINAVAAAGLGVYYDDLGVQDGDDTGSSFESSRYTPIPAPGVFHHLAATYWQISNNVVRLEMYLDGQNVRTRYIAGNLANTINSTPVTIGATAQGAGEFFQGVIDEVTLYNRVLSATEIQSIYAADTAGKCAHPGDSCFTPPAGLVSWWRAEGNATDSASVNHGTLTGAADYTTGRIGQAFDFDGDRDGVSAGTAANLQLQDFSVEAWIKRRSDSVISFNGNGNGQLFTVGAGGGGATFYLQADSRLALGKLQVSQVTSAAMVTDTNWHHVAVTKAGPAVTFFVDGVAYAAPAYDSGGFTFNGPAYIGAWLNPSQLVDNTFYGAIDEMAVYNRALTTNEIAALYNASAEGKCVPAVTPPVITQHPQDTVVIAGGTAQFAVAATGVPAPGYQWYFQTDPLPGQTNATLLLGNVLPDKQGTYSVRVFNPSGALLSSNASLTVVTTQAVVLVDGTTAGFYNEALGTILDGTAPQFPLPLGQGDDPTLFPADEPNLAAATNILGDWFAMPPALNSNWQAVTVIPDTWALNTETAIIYPVDAGSYGIANLRGDFDADNGIYVWVNGQYRFGARAPGLPAPIGQYEYTNVFLGNLPPGSNYIQILREDSGISVGYQIRITGTALSTNRQPPVIVQSPTNQTVAAGSSASFTVGADGTPELSYQWRFEGADLAGQTGNSLTLLNVQPTNAGGYSVLITNAYGAVTSSIATLTVLTYPPTITRQPTNLTVIETAAAIFSVQATGSGTLAYQWWFNDQPLAGKTSPSLAFTSVQSSNAGNYFVIVTNPYGAVTSSVATLTVNPRPPCAPVHDGLVSWWPGENSALDAWDSNNGSTLGIQYANGKVGRAFVSPLISVADAPSLQVTNALTLEAWVNPFSVSSVRVLLAKHEYPPFQPLGTQSAYLLGLTNNGALFFILTPNGSVRTNTMLTTTNTLPINQWSHVAATYDGAVMRLYLNGTQVGQQTHTGGIFPGTAPLGIGGFSMGTSSPWQFSGLLDEVSLYNRALSATEIQSLFNADMTGKCLTPPLITQQSQSQAVPLGEDVKLTATVIGSRPLRYQWYFNGAPTQFTTQRIAGATNAALVIEKIKTTNVGTYTLRVTNSAGFDLGAPIQLSLAPAPACTEMLPGLIGWWPGNSNTLDVTGLNNISSYQPLSYPTGKVASAFAFNGTSSRITINNTASLNFSSNANFSIEMWIRATNSPPAPGGGSPYPNVPLFEKRTTPTTGWVGYSLSLNQGRLAFAIGTPGTAAPGAVSNYISSGPDLRDAMFHHVAVTVNRSTTNGGVLYVDGVPVLTFNPKPLNVSLINSSPLFLGAPTVTFSNSYFAGLIDEPAIYSRDLTAAEILALRTAGAAGRCKSAPIIVTQPTNQFVTNGGSATLSVTVTGTPLLRYQWRRNTLPVPSGTNSTLALSNITSSIAGTYSVIVSNAFGGVTSSNAIVGINRLPVANPDSLTTPSNTAVVFPAAKLLLNDTDADGDVLNVASVSGISGQNGSVSLVSNVVTYTPPVNFTGNDTFTYMLTDKPGVTTVGTVMVTVGSGGVAPMNIIAGPTVVDGQFVVRFAGIPGLTYTIETSTSLAGPWSKVANLTAPETDAGLGVGIFEFREPVVGEGARYYRTVYPAY